MEGNREEILKKACSVDFVIAMFDTNDKNSFDYLTDIIGEIRTLR